jgi:hypothetical protein
MSSVVPASDEEGSLGPLARWRSLRVWLRARLARMLAYPPPKCETPHNRGRIKYRYGDSKPDLGPGGAGDLPETAGD